MYADKEIIIFDLDDTLAKIKTAITDEMGQLLAALLEKKKVAIISGCKYEMFEKQGLKSLLISSEQRTSFYLLPTCAAACYTYSETEAWQPLYEEMFTTNERDDILGALDTALHSSEFEHPETIYGDQIEDRQSQITFSGVGQEAPYDVKKTWDPDCSKRLALQKELSELLPGFSIRVAGASSVDITREGIHKGYGIRKITEHFGIPKEKMLFIGDKLMEGGNDYPVKEEGVECLQVNGPDDTANIIRAILAD